MMGGIRGPDMHFMQGIIEEQPLKSMQRIPMSLEK